MATYAFRSLRMNRSSRTFIQLTSDNPVGSQGFDPRIEVSMGVLQAWMGAIFMFFFPAKTDDEIGVSLFFGGSSQIDNQGWNVPNIFWNDPDKAVRVDGWGSCWMISYSPFPLRI